uniref:Uncharacterized protein n=1 Tax=Poecilia latipinna TaxID=48699 RepID=A0A3B3TQF2_9TELE
MDQVAGLTHLSEPEHLPAAGAFVLLTRTRSQVCLLLSFLAHPSVILALKPGDTSEDRRLFQCMSDLECTEGNYCHVPTRGPAHSRCHACRRRSRRCLRDSMCCPGNRCSNICVPVLDGFWSQSVLDADGDVNPPSKRGWRKRGRVNLKGSFLVPGQLGDPCLRSSDCSDTLCCARHFWARICKPVLREGQVCTRQRRKGHQGLELFQRCSCGEGLTCRASVRRQKLSVCWVVDLQTEKYCCCFTRWTINLVSMTTS